MICRDCALVKHRDHDYTFIREIRPEIQQQLEALTKEVQAKEVEYKSHIDYLENIREIGTNTLATCKHKVNETCDQLKEAIESRRAALIAQLHDIHDSEKKLVDHEAEGLQFTLSKLSNSIGFTKQLLANGSDLEVVSMSVQAVQTLEDLKAVNWNKNSIKPTLMRVKFDPEFEKHVNKFGATSHEFQPEDLLVKLPKETAFVGEEVKFEVHLSKEISERGYDATSELAVQLVHTTNNAKTVCNLCKTNPNTWEASCIPDAEGKYQVSAVLGDMKIAFSTFEAHFHQTSKLESSDSDEFEEPTVVEPWPQQLLLPEQQGNFIAKTKVKTSKVTARTSTSTPHPQDRPGPPYRHPMPLQYQHVSSMPIPYHQIPQQPIPYQQIQIPQHKQQSRRPERPDPRNHKWMDI